MKYLIKGGKIIDFKSDCFKYSDILIDGKIIVKIDKNIQMENDYNLINAENKYIVPGLIDAHVHLREPGFENKETIKTGTMACAKGGFTHVFSMPNTMPNPDSEKNIDKIQKIIEKDAVIKVTPIASITEGSLGGKLVDFEKLSKKNIAGFSDDGNPVFSEELMRISLLKSFECKKSIITHSEDKSTFSIGAVNRGKVSEYYNVDGIPNEAEYKMIDRDIEILKETSGYLHICHISTKESVKSIREAKRKGLNITCEVTPHHFSLSEDVVIEKGPYAKVNPPLRKSEDIDEIIQGIKDGTIDIIVTDHAPHEDESKNTDIVSATYGFSGAEIAFKVAYTYLVKSGVINLVKLIKFMSYNPAKIFNLKNEGDIKNGFFANLTILDLDKSKIVKTDEFISKGKNSPYDGMKLDGEVIMTIYNGEIVYEGEM